MVAAAATYIDRAKNKEVGRVEEEEEEREDEGAWGNKGGRKKRDLEMWKPDGFV